MSVISPDIALWLVSIMVLLTMVGAATVMLLGMRRQQGAVQARLTGVVASHGPTRAVATGRRVRPKREQSALFAKFLAFAGYNPDRKAQYPIAWYFVVVAAVVLARILAYLEELLIGPMAILSMPLLIWVLARSYWRFYDNKRRKMLYEQFPDALGSIVRAVRVGIPVSEALRGVSRDAAEPTGEEFRRLSDQVWIGASLESALTDIAERSGVAEYRFFATAISLQAQTGGGLSETLDTLAEVIRQRIALRKRGYALAAEARTSAGLLAALPFVTGGAMALLNPEYIGILFTDPTGRKILAGAIGMLLLGISVMRWLIKKSLS